MTKQHTRIRNFALLLVIVTVVGLTIYGQKVKEIKKSVEAEIELQQAEIDDKNKELEQLNKEYKEMDSKEYVKKIANEKLGMVEEDTIVFKIKK